MSAWFYTSNPNHSNQTWLANHANCEECDARIKRTQLRVYNDSKVCYECFKLLTDGEYANG